MLGKSQRSCPITEEDALSDEEVLVRSNRGAWSPRQVANCLRRFQQVQEFSFAGGILDRGRNQRHPTQSEALSFLFTRTWSMRWSQIWLLKTLTGPVVVFAMTDELEGPVMGKASGSGSSERRWDSNVPTSTFPILSKRTTCPRCQQLGSRPPNLWRGKLQVHFVMGREVADFQLRSWRVVNQSGPVMPAVGQTAFGQNWCSWCVCVSRFWVCSRLCVLCVLCLHDFLVGVLKTFGSPPQDRPPPLGQPGPSAAAQNFARFFLSRRKFHSFFSLWGGSSRWFFFFFKAPTLWAVFPDFTSLTFWTFSTFFYFLNFFFFSFFFFFKINWFFTVFIVFFCLFFFLCVFFLFVIFFSIFLFFRCTKVQKVQKVIKS